MDRKRPIRDRQTDALDGFKALGAASTNALRALSKLVMTHADAMNAALVLSGLGHEGMVALNSAVTNSDPEIRYAAAVALASSEVVDSNGVVSLRLLIRDDREHIRNSALGTLIRIHDEPAFIVPVLIRKLAARTSLDRRLAVSWLSEYAAESPGARAALSAVTRKRK